MIDVDVMTGPGDWSQIADIDSLAQRAVEAALATVKALQSPGELSILLTNDAGIQELNRTWRGFDKPTNVLSFPGSGAPSPDSVRHLGDIALAYETVTKEAAEERKSLADHSAHLIVHGVLHLLGYDHEVEGEAEAMEAFEVAALARLGIADPYHGMAA